MVTEEPVPVNVTSNGIDTATITLTKPIALDGSDDGTYTITVTPVDLAGNNRSESENESERVPVLRRVLPRQPEA